MDAVTEALSRTKPQSVVLNARSTSDLRLCAISVSSATVSARPVVWRHRVGFETAKLREKLSCNKKTKEPIPS
eukprot:6492784-Amphidinium_carterae.1